MEPTKVCSKCKTEKLRTQFPWKDRKGGKIKAHCQSCDNLRLRKYEGRYKDKKVIYWRKRYQDNREEMIAQSAAWRRNNREQYLLTSKIHGANSKAKNLGIPGVLTVEEWLAIVEATGSVCLRCGRPGDAVSLTIDHVVPFRKKGHNTIDNIQPLCLHCNCVKGTREIDFRSHQFTLMDPS